MIIGPELEKHLIKNGIQITKGDGNNNYFLTSGSTRAEYWPTTGKIWLVGRPVYYTATQNEIIELIKTGEIKQKQEGLFK